MADNDKCPKCGAAANHRTDNGPTLFACGSWTGDCGASGLQSQTCRIAELEQRLAKAERERDDLAAWKQSELAVEAEWDIQAIARELNVPLGMSIRPAILPGIIALKKERDAARKATAEAVENERRGCEEIAREKAARYYNERHMLTRRSQLIYLSKEQACYEIAKAIAARGQGNRT